jgi:hypothetical protein
MDCVYRKLKPGRSDGEARRGSGVNNDSGLMNRTGNRRILVQRPMRSDGVVIIGV